MDFSAGDGGPHEDSSRAGCGPRAGRCASLIYSNRSTNSDVIEHFCSAYTGGQTEVMAV